MPLPHLGAPPYHDQDVREPSHAAAPTPAEPSAGDALPNLIERFNQVSLDLVNTHIGLLQESQYQQEQQQQELLSTLHQLSDHMRGLDQQVADLRKWKAEVDLRHVDFQILESGKLDAEVEPESVDVDVGGIDGMDRIKGSKRKPRNAGAIGAAKSTVSDTLEEYRPTYEWEDSVYDSMLLAFIHGLNWESSLLLVIGFCVNVSMVALTCFIVAGDEFRDDPFQNKQDYLNWRYWDAHSYLRAETTTSMTLGTRVCDKDRGLSFANSQSALVHEMDKYGEGHQGVLLCNVAVMLWICCCAGELRRTLNFSLVLANFPRGKHTTLRVYDDGIEFLTLSWVRCVLGLLIATVRGTFAMFLVYYGSAWLAYTTSIEDLLLNASALGFVLDIDNTIFNIIAPQKAIALFAGILKPGELPKRFYVKTIPFCMLLVMIGATLYVNLHFIGPMNDTMKEIQKALCEPVSSMKFAIGANPLGWLTYTNQTQSSAEVDANLKLIPQYNILKEMVFNPTNYTQYALKLEGLVAMQTVAVAELSEYVDTFSCDDHNTVGDDSDATVGTRLFGITGDESMKKYKKCEDIRQFCQMTDPTFMAFGQSVRLMCPDTCGCSSPTAVLWNTARSEFGCPQRACKSRLLRTLRRDTYKCEDYSFQDLDTTGWNYMVGRMKGNGDISESVQQNLTDLGCDAFKYLPDWQILDLCSMNSLSTFHGAASLCPESCRCKDGMQIGATENCPNICPKSCCNQ